MTKSTVETIILGDEDEYIEKLRTVCEQFRQHEGVPYKILVESGLDAFEKEGRLVSGCLSDKNESDKIDTYAIETCLDALKKESYIKECIDPYFSLEKIYYECMGDDELPFDNGSDERVVRFLKPNMADVFLCEMGLDVYKFPESYRYLAYQTAYLACYYPNLNREMEERESAKQSLSREDEVQRALEIYYSYESVSPNNALQEEQIGLVYDWNKVDFTATLIQRRNDEVEIFWQESIPDINILLVDAVQEEMKAIMMEEKEVLEIFGLDESNEKVWKKFYDATWFVLEELRKGKNVELKLESYLASVTQDFTQEQFEKILEYFYRETQMLIVEILQRAGFQVEDLSKLYVAGVWCDCKYIKQNIYEFINI